MNSYSEFAQYYDLFMEDVDYTEWSEYVLKIAERFGMKPEKILDAACGTGNITIPLAMKGYKMWGLDLSGDMLSIAESKARALKQKIKFLNQDMQNININETFDCVLCMCDGVNYILEEAGLRKFFKAAYERLNKTGIFIFDISSYNKLHYILGNNTFYDEKNNIHYVWNNIYNEEFDTVDMDLMFFVPEGSLYRRFDEHHVQKAYKNEMLIKLLLGTGFSKVETFDSFSFENPKEDSERIFFAAVKTTLHNATGGIYEELSYKRGKH